MDVPYYPVFPYKQRIYNYSNNKWKEIESLEIVKENDSSYTNFKSRLLGLNDKTLTLDLKGNYQIKTNVLSIETGEPIEMSFYFNFDGSRSILSLGGVNSIEAYCEGTYNVVEKDNIIRLEYDDEGVCTSDTDESLFIIKKEDGQFYIKSKRFYEDQWIILKRE